MGVLLSAAVLLSKYFLFSRVLYIQAARSWVEIINQQGVNHKIANEAKEAYT
jgi:hypothetical protein